MKVIKFWREVGLFLNTYDFKKDADASIRKAKATQAGNGIVEIAEKWFGA